MTFKSKKLETVGPRAFYGCASLTSVSINAKNIHFANHAFEKCKKLKDISFFERARSCGPGLFRDCTGIRKAVLPAGLQNVASNVFNGCKNLRSITVKGTRTTVKKSADSIYAGKKIFAKKAFKGLPKKCTITVKNRKVKAAVEKTGYKGTIVVK